MQVYIYRSYRHQNKFLEDIKMKHLTLTVFTGIVAVGLLTSAYAAQGSGSGRGARAGQQGQVCPIGQTPPKDGTGNQQGKVKRSGNQGVVCPDGQTPPRDGTGSKRRGK
jgi:hypothetical protein